MSTMRKLGGSGRSSSLRGTTLSVSLAISSNERNFTVTMFGITAANPLSSMAVHKRPRRFQMRNEEKFRAASQRLLDAIGGENLIGSGFEEEMPEPEFTPATTAAESRER